MKKPINLKVNGIDVVVEAGAKILEAANKAGFNIPTLCYLKDVCNDGSCRVCVVEAKGAKHLVTACSTAVREGMEVFTNTPKVMESRKTTIELMLSNHNQKCLSCVRSTNCELQALSNEYNCDQTKFGNHVKDFPLDDSNPYLVRDNTKCILCRRCVAVCKNVQEVGVIGPNKRGYSSYIGCAFDQPLGETACVACGQCIKVCPVGALYERDDNDKVKKLLADPTKYVIAGTAPSVRVGLGEEFGYPIGTDVEGKMVTALKRIGFKDVFDVDMTADMTIMEEAYELLGRLGDKTAALPMITSCSPGWINYIEAHYPELLGHLSSCKSPQQMFGAIMKTYYAEKKGIDPKDIAVVSVMPCTAKKVEILRDHQNASGYPDIDVVITTREFARLIKASGLNFQSLPDSEFDAPIGMGSTAGLIFGATGGVMEAALRTAAEVITKRPLEKVDFKAVRGTKGIKKAEVDLDGTKLKVCVAHTLANAKQVLEEIKAGKADYQFVEIMACPGGCVNGGGQPIQPSSVLNTQDVREIRASAIYKMDKGSTLRKSHENPVVKKLYSEYFGEPNSHKAHKILHTYYKKKNKY